MNRSKKWLRVYQVCLTLGLIAAGLGCSPSNLLWFLNRDDKAPAQFPLEAKKGKDEVTIAVVATANPAILSFPEFAGIDRDLAQQFSMKLTEETLKQKKPVKVIEQAKVNAMKSKNPTAWDIANRSQLAKELGADYLIEVDMSQFSTYSKETGREVCHGKATVNVRVYDAAGDGSAKVEYGHTSQPPLRSTGDMTSQHYKQFLIKHLAKELTQKHVPHTPDRDVPTQLR